jgi:DNA-binding transcriptional LysR family regulator
MSSMPVIAPLYDRVMETRLLEYFIAVAEERSVTAAARRLYAAQSTVSAGLKSLERELGVRLLERSTKAVALTPAGEGLLPLARSVLDGVAAVEHMADESEHGLRGRIRFGTFTGMNVLDLPSALGAFRRSHPLVDVRLTASPRGSVGLADDLENDRLDLALLALPAAAGLRSWSLGSYPFVALTAPSHPLAARLPGGRVSIAELADEDWIDVLAGYGNRVQLEAELARRGIVRRIAAELGELPAVPQFVAAGLGIAVVPRIVDTAGCAVLEIDDALPEWTLSLAAGRRALDRPHVRALLESLVS